MQITDRVRRRLAESQTVIGVGTSLNSALSVEYMVGSMDLDFIVVDMQQSDIDSAHAVHMLRAAQAADPGIFPMIRVPNYDVYWMQQVLDSGYFGLVAPLCESAEQAQQMVDACYYPPRGARSKAGSFRAMLYEDYLARVNDEIILLPQIESARGLENVEEILSVDGVTGVLLGPVDLCLSCGWFGDDLWSLSPFVEAVKRIKEACESRGKVLATMTGGDGVYHAQRLGIDIISIGADGGAIRVTMANQVGAVIERLRTPS